MIHLVMSENFLTKMMIASLAISLAKLVKELLTIVLFVLITLMLFMKNMIAKISELLNLKKSIPIVNAK